jgi:NADH-ubiquinone oxidoreductase chain 4
VLYFRRDGLFSFYIFFGGKLIPTLFLILVWGYQPDGIRAGIYLLFLLVGILFVLKENTMKLAWTNEWPKHVAEQYTIKAYQ